MKNSTSLKREHDFQGSGGSGNTVFVICWCLVSGLAWGSFFMDFGTILGSNVSQKIDKKP